MATAGSCSMAITMKEPCLPAENECWIHPIAIYANFSSFIVPLLQAKKVADEMADDSTRAATNSPDKVHHSLLLL